MPHALRRENKSGKSWHITFVLTLHTNTLTQTLHITHTHTYILHTVLPAQHWPCLKKNKKSVTLINWGCGPAGQRLCIGCIICFVCVCVCVRYVCVKYTGSYVMCIPKHPMQKKFIVNTDIMHTHYVVQHWSDRTPPPKVNDLYGWLKIKIKMKYVVFQLHPLRLPNPGWIQLREYTQSMQTACIFYITLILSRRGGHEGVFCKCVSIDAARWLTPGF